MRLNTYLLVVFLIVIAVMSRLVPHPANFAPVAAVAIFGGALLPRRWAVALPLSIMIVSDLIIGLHPLIFFTWGSFMAVALVSNLGLKTITVSRVGVAGVGASVFFYLVSNFGVWLEGRLYPHTWQGLVSCYTNALPFFRNTLLGDITYVALLFGAYALATALAQGGNARLAPVTAQNSAGSMPRGASTQL